MAKSKQAGSVVKRPEVEIRDRVVGMERRAARYVQTHPMNWRTHPKNQRAAMRGVLREVGFVKPVDTYTPREGDDLVVSGKLKAGVPCLIDGHLRTDTVDPDFKIPINLTDLTEREALKYLATCDPLAALAGQDDERLMEVFGEIDTDDAAVQAMLADLVDLDENGGDESDDSNKSEVYNVLVQCQDADEQQSALEQCLAMGLNARASM
jgi:hypothetical protein